MIYQLREDTIQHVTERHGENQAFVERGRKRNTKVKREEEGNKIEK